MLRRPGSHVGRSKRLKVCSYKEIDCIQLTKVVPYVSFLPVYDNEGGVTHFTGGAQCIVIPAGYVGGAFWGGAFVAMSGHRIGATVGALIISLALMGSLCYKPNKTVVFISVGFTIVTLAAIAVDWFIIDPFLQVSPVRRSKRKIRSIRLTSMLCYFTEFSLATML